MGVQQNSSSFSLRNTILIIYLFLGISLFAQSQPTKEYIRLNGRLIATETTNASPCSQAVSNLKFYSTGRTAQNNAAQQGDVDGNYRLVSNPGSFGGASGSDAIVGNGFLGGNLPTASFVSAVSSPLNIAPGVYVFRQKLDLSCHQIATTRIEAGVVADNSVQIYVNGKLTLASFSNAWAEAPMTLTGTGFTQNLIQGWNEIDFVVTNDGPGDNPSSLRVNVTLATATPDPNSTGSKLLVTSPGGNRSNNSNVNITSDAAATWTVEGNPPGTFSGPNGTTATYTSPSTISSLLVVPVRAASLSTPTRVGYNTLYFNPGAAGTLGSTFVSQTGLTSNMPTGQGFSATLTFQNSGGLAWNAATVKLVKQDGPNPCTYGVTEVPLGQNTATNANASFTINGTAPSAAGTCTFQWQLRDGASTLFGAVYSFQIAFAASSNNATPQSVSMPSSLFQGQSFSSTITMLNPTGGTTWDMQASAGTNQIFLGSQSPANNVVWGTNVATTTSTTVAAGNTATFTVQGRAPVNTTGSQTFDWQMRQGSNGWFGTIARPATSVNVIAGTKGATISNVSIPAQVNVGDAFNISFDIQNTGSAIWWGAGVYAPTAFRFKSTDSSNPSLWGRATYDLPRDYVDPTQTIRVTIPLVAPTTPGNQTIRWAIEQLGSGTFGPELNQTIEVRAQNPGIINVTPTSGQGAEQTFSATFVGGQGEVVVGNFLFTNVNGGNANCRVDYYQPQNRLSLLDLNAGTVQYGTPGVVSTLANDYCYLKLGDSSVNRNGTTVTTVQVRIGFRNPMAGSTNTYALWTSNSLGVNLGWLAQGQWVVPVAVNVLVSPTTVSLSSNQSQQFTATVTGTSNTNVGWWYSGWGNITSSGLFTAATVTSQQNVTVRATSQADNTKYGEASLTIFPTASAVSITSFTPQQGYGRQQIYTVTANGGNAPIASLTIYTNSTQLNPGGCQVVWYPQSNYISVTSNGGPSYGAYLGSYYTQSNYSTCGVILWNSSGSYSGYNATLSIAMDYSIWSWFSYLNNYARATNTAGASMLDWQYVGYTYLP